LLRIHFGDADLSQVRIAGGPDPMWEILLSLHAWGTPRMQAAYGWWWNGVRRRGHVPSPLLRGLAPPTGYSADFLTPMYGTGDLTDGITAVLRTPRKRLRNDLDLLASQYRLPTSAVRLSTADPAALQDLGGALAVHHRAALAPYWGEVRAGVQRDRLDRGRVLLESGVDGLLDTLHPTVRWRRPVLQVHYPDERDLRLDGRGLVLQPSVFCWRMPITLLESPGQPVLVYPIGTGAQAFTPGHRAVTTGALTRLLGRTRAATLEATEHGATTGELAVRLGIAASTASEHVTVLRKAGLVASRPDGAGVRHALTDLGRRLLNASVPV